MKSTTDNEKFILHLAGINPLYPEAKEAVLNLCAAVRIKKNKDLQSISETTFIAIPANPLFELFDHFIQDEERTGNE